MKIIFENNLCVIHLNLFFFECTEYLAHYFEYFSFCLWLILFFLGLFSLHAIKNSKKKELIKRKKYEEPFKNSDIERSESRNFILLAWKNIDFVTNFILYIIISEWEWSLSQNLSQVNMFIYIFQSYYNKCSFHDLRDVWWRLWKSFLMQITNFRNSTKTH